MKMIKQQNRQFFEWYIEWIKKYNILDNISIMFSLPTKFTSFKSDNSNHIILEIFEKKNLAVNAKPYLKKIIEAADNYNVTIFIEPIPRFKYINDEDYKNKITKEYLISYYESFGFSKDENGFMVKKPSIPFFNK